MELIIKKKITSLAVVFIISISSALAQEFELAGIEYAHYPAANMNEQDAKDAKNTFNELLVFGRWPTAFSNNKTIIINGIKYARVESYMEDLSIPFKSTQTFHRLMYSFSIVQILNKKWVLFGQLSPTLASDFKENLNKEDFNLQGVALASRKINESSRLGGGLVYTTRLGRPLWLPVVQYSFKQKKHDLDIALPAYIKYYYTVDRKEKLKVGALMEINGASFNMGSENPLNEYLDKVQYSRVNAGLILKYRLAKYLQINASSGVCVARLFNFEDILGNSYDYSSNIATYFNIGASFVLPRS